MNPQFTTAEDSTSETFWDKAQFDLDTLTIDDMYNGNSDFEYMWTQMMQIMIPVTILRMVPQTGNRGTEDRKTEGQKIQGMLRQWEDSLPASFMEIDPPETMMLLDSAILQPLQPLYYASLRVAVAMGISSQEFTNSSASFSITSQCIHTYSSGR
jgi:hypothetical protein